MWDIGFMAWRIGEIVDVDAQLDWIEAAGLEAASFHAAEGAPPEWRGVDPRAAGPRRRVRLRERLSRFRMCEVHAPFSLAIPAEGSPQTVDRLGEVLRFAGDVGAKVVTVHAAPPAEPRASDGWQGDLDRLDALAAGAGVTVGLELMGGFEWLAQPRRPHVGLTLDVGHMYLGHGAPLRPYGGIGGLVRAVAETLVHLHVHDYDGAADHVEVGTGRVDFDDLLRTLAEAGYRGAMCLELNPRRCEPEGIRRSAAFLRHRAEALGAC